MQTSAYEQEQQVDIMAFVKRLSKGLLHRTFHYMTDVNLDELHIRLPTDAKKKESMLRLQL
jgi:hypothetical protein